MANTGNIRSDGSLFDDPMSKTVPEYLAQTYFIKDPTLQLLGSARREDPKVKSCSVVEDFALLSLLSIYHFSLSSPHFLSH